MVRSVDISLAFGQMRQPGRSIDRDLDRTTFTDFLDTLLD